MGDISGGSAFLPVPVLRSQRRVLRTGVDGLAVLVLYVVGVAGLVALR